MRIDMHAHLDPRILEPSTMERKLDDAQVDRVVLIASMNDPLPKTPKALLSIVRGLMERAATRPLAEMIHRQLLTSDGNYRVSGEVVRIYATPDNEPVANIVQARPNRFLGWIFLNPAADPQVLETLERYRVIPGMVGLKLHPHWHDYRTDLLDPVLRRAEELGMPVLVHLGFGKRGNFREMAERFPKLRIIAAHAGFPFYRDLWRYKGECPNLFVDLSSPYINERLARDAVAAMGAERCLYGTDAPYGFHEDDGSYDYGEIASWVERLPISSNAQERIMGRGFAELIDLTI